MSAVITYTNVNGYLIPNLAYKSGEQMEQLGKYGFLRRDYLKNHRNSTYQVMLLQDTIGKHLLEVDKVSREREDAKRCLVAGMTAHLAKPFQIEDVEKTIVECCGK